VGKGRSACPFDDMNSRVGKNRLTDLTNFQQECGILKRFLHKNHVQYNALICICCLLITCISPRLNGPKSPPRFAELQSEYCDAISSNVVSPEAILAA